jgi:transcriptional regulator with XRE-family HTH domain
MAAKRHRLTQRRKTVGFSQGSTLAERVGVDRSTVGRWETGLTEHSALVTPPARARPAVSVEQLDALLEAPSRARPTTSRRPN